MQMDIFISWSGQRSNAVARALHAELPNFVHGVKPFMSEIDVDKGKRALVEIEKNLGASGCGIFCVTPENVSRDWLNFEGGAISVKVDSNVWTYLFGLTNKGVLGPLSQFQHTPATKEQTLKLVKSIHAHAKTGTKEVTIDETFEIFWPRLEAKLGKIARHPLPHSGNAFILGPDNNASVPPKWVEMHGKFEGDEQDFWLLGKRGTNEYWPHARLKWEKNSTWKGGVGYGDNKGEVKQVLAWVSPQMNAVLESWKRFCHETKTWSVPIRLAPSLADFIEVDWRTYKVAAASTK